MIPAIPENEAVRLEALNSYQILDTPYEQEYDNITMLASQICGTPIAAISLIDGDRQWFKSQVGLDVRETPRDDAFCAHALDLSPADTLVVSDALEDARFAENPLVTNGPNIRFYAGAPLVTSDNNSLGTLCVIDRQPRQLSEQQIAALHALARQVTMQLELRRMSLQLQNVNQELRNLSLTDELTGLYNQRGFMFHAEHQLKLFRSRRSEQGLWMMMADLDRLKPINDTYGHKEGSLAILNAAEILAKTFRNADIVARLGGDEFAVLIINTFDNVKEKIAERLEEKLYLYNETSGKPYELSMSYGMVPIEFDDSSSIDDLLKLADEVMYEQKRNKKAAR